MFPEKKWKQSSGKSGSLTIIIISVLLFIINRNSVISMYLQANSVTLLRTQTL